MHRIPSPQAPVRGWCRTGADAATREVATAVQMIALRAGRQLEELFPNRETFAALLPFKVRLWC